MSANPETGIGPEPAAAQGAIARYCARCFLAIGLPTILALVFLIPPLQVADEPAHFLRATAIAEGNVLPTVGQRARPTTLERRDAGSALEEGVGSFAHSGLPHDRNARWSPDVVASQYAIHAGARYRFTAFSNTAIYPPLPYLVPAAAILATRGLTARPLIWMYAGRIAGAVVAAMLLAWAISRGLDAAPFLLLVASSPLTLFTMAGVSADALLLPSAFVLATITVRIHRGLDVSGAEIALLAIAMTVVGVGKIAYLPLTALPVLASWLRSGAGGRQTRLLALTACGVAALWLGWTMAVADKVFSIRDFVPIDPRRQLSLLIRQPARIVALYRDVIGKEGGRIVAEINGYKLGWSEFGMPAWFCDVYLGLTAAFAATRFTAGARTWRLFSAAAGIALGCIVAISLLLYAQYNEVGSARLDGIQGRYIVPLLVVAVCAMPRFRLARAGRYARAIAVIPMASAASVLVTVASRYWG